MCIIVAKPKNASMPKREYLKNSFTNNPDGAGVMYTDNNRVVIEKGFMTWELFEKRLDELCVQYDNFKDKCFVAHFRIGTQGNNDEHTCHPFPITSNFKKLRKTHLRTDVAMVHNGIIHEYSTNGYSVYNNRGDNLLSDTQLFIKYCVTAFKSLNRCFYKNNQVMTCLDKIADSKLCFLDKEDNLYFLGDYDECDGVYYSNSTYHPFTTHYLYPKNNNYDNEVYWNYDGYYLGDMCNYLTPFKEGDVIDTDNDNTIICAYDGEYWLDSDVNYLYSVDNDGCLVFEGIGMFAGRCPHILNNNIDEEVGFDD